MSVSHISLSQRVDLIKTALGKSQADLVFKGGHFVNVYTGEILENLWIGVKGDRVAYVGSPHPDMVGEGTSVFDLQNRFMLPGLIDGHTHLDSIFKVGAYAEYALPSGNTAAVSEIAMIANAFGVEGVKFFLQEAFGLPFKVFILAPPLVPPFPELESSRPFPHEFFHDILTSEGCVGVGETYWPRLNALEERALKQYQLADALGKTMEGHAAGARKEKLVAYVAGGTSSCHEATDPVEALERLRLGLALMIREGYVRRELRSVSRIFEQPVDLRNVMLVTDMADPEEMVTEGGMNLLLRKAVSLGLDPVKAIQMATINVARYFRLRERGGLAPGKIADMVIVDDLKDFHCHEVWVDGRLAAREGKLVNPLKENAYPEKAMHSIAFGKMQPAVFQIQTPLREGDVRVVEIINETITKEYRHPMKSQDGKLHPEPEKDILEAAVFNKSRSDVPPSLCFVKGVGLRKGAVATSLIWDTNNVLVVGTSANEMAAAINRLIDLGGGVVVVADESPVAELALPICGIISPEPLPVIVQKMREVESACRSVGSELSRPLLTFQTLPFTGLPYLRPTDKGLADIRKGELVPIIS